jgi:hypothetical protein
MIIKIKKKKLAKTKKKIIMKKGNKTQNYIVNSSLDSLPNYFYFYFIFLLFSNKKFKTSLKFISHKSITKL